MTTFLIEAVVLCACFSVCFLLLVIQDAVAWHVTWVLYLLGAIFALALLMLLCALGFVGVIVYGGWDGVRNGFTFGRFLTRFLVILLGMKAFDIIALDYILITKTQFFQHYIPETKGCAGYHSFGYNRKEQLTRILTLPFAALLTAWVCTLF